MSESDNFYNIKEGDLVMMVCECPGFFEPPCGTVGEVVKISQHDLRVKWPAGSTQAGGDDTYWSGYYSVAPVAINDSLVPAEDDEIDALFE